MWRRIVSSLTVVLTICAWPSSAFPDAGNALSFDRTDEVVIPYSDDFRFTASSEFTIEFWVKRTSDDANMDIIGRRVDCTMTFNYLIGREAANNIYMKFMNNWTWVSSGVDIPLNEWAHMAVTYDGSQVRIYIDGAWVYTQAHTMEGYANTADVKFGASGTCPDGLVGELDEVRYWSVARTDQEILDNYNHFVDPASPDLIGYWNFDESTGNQNVLDQTGNGHDGTLGVDLAVGDDDPARVVSTAPVTYVDSDGDGVPDDIDNCPAVSNPLQSDSDGDDVGDLCDNCESHYNPNQEDIDLDGVGDSCDVVQVINVDAAGTGDQATIQAAIDFLVSQREATRSAQAEGDPPLDTILLGDGVYTGAGNRDIDFKGERLVLKSANGPTNCTIDCQGSQAEPHRAFYFHTFEDSLSILDGLTVTNGFAPNYLSSGGNNYNFGGAVFCFWASPLIRNCVFSGNEATWDTAGALVGGGGVEFVHSIVKIRDCEFYSNVSFWGGGLEVNNCDSAFISGCTFDGNSVSGVDQTFGGGLSVYASTATITDCDFTGNEALSSSEWQPNGGGLCAIYSTVSATGCTFEDNNSENSVNGYGWGGAAITWSGGIQFSECEFIGNTGHKGGAIMAWSGPLDLFDCLLEGNSTTGTDNSGGAVILAQEYDNQSQFSSSFDDCLFFDNSAYRGGSVYAYYHYLLNITGCTFVQNSAAADGACITNDNSQCHFERSIVSLNSDCDAITSVGPALAGFRTGWASSALFTGSGIPQLLARGDLVPEAALTNPPAGTPALTNASWGDGIPTFVCTDIYANEYGDWVGAIAGLEESDNNFSRDPLFCDVGADDFRIDYLSPCEASNNDCATLIGSEAAACSNCNDIESDGYCYGADNCSEIANPLQEDGDTDGVGDACDNCLSDSNPDQADSDGDGNGDACDLCPGYDDALDSDADGVPDGCDVCEGYDDGLDQDSDGVPDDCDVCPSEYDPYQFDTDGDGAGDACDLCEGWNDGDDADADGVPDGCDICAGFDDNVDTDGDGVPDGCDNCSAVYNPAQYDTDGDATGDACDLCTDTDDDGHGNPGGWANTCDTDNCPFVANAGQSDSDGDGFGDACDPTGYLVLDSVANSVGESGLMAGWEHVFVLHLNTEDLPDDINALANCFYVYSPDRATITVAGGAVLPVWNDFGWTEPFVFNRTAAAGSGNWINTATPFVISEFDSASCTFAGYNGNGSIASGFDGQVWTLTVQSDEADIGKHICLGADVDGTWEWAKATTSYYPGWGGPYCFEIIDCAGDDTDNDGYPDPCDPCPNDAYNDEDGDGLCGDVDECTDTDGDGYGNPGYPANLCATDNCPFLANPDQTDTDGDGLGDVCDFTTVYLEVQDNEGATGVTDSSLAVDIYVLVDAEVIGGNLGFTWAINEQGDSYFRLDSVVFGPLLQQWGVHDYTSPDGVYGSDANSWVLIGGTAAPSGPPLTANSTQLWATMFLTLNSPDWVLGVTMEIDSSYVDPGGPFELIETGSQTFVPVFDAPLAVFPADSDGDGVVDVRDNCPDDYNPGQEDADEDGEGDVCDDGCCDTAGDANHDGSVNIADAVFLVNYIYHSGDAPPCDDEADFSGNNSVTIDDVNGIYYYIFLGGDPPVCGTTGT